MFTLRTTHTTYETAKVVLLVIHEDKIQFQSPIT